ncbi:hypothetical protein COCOBI_18-0220 [Coccomyxa sp. Obi]|nr:hypothetical protein COCOBI_18-0220 [Coccomyxa sp. Obi]
MTFSKADKQHPVIGDVYMIAGSTGPLTQPAASGKDTLSIQSATAATPGPVCEGPPQCQALCPTVDFTKAQPALTAAAVQQQLTQCANAMRTSPGSFASIINSVCNYADFETDITQPPRPPFIADSFLSTVAENHANDMATTNIFNHYSQNGSSPYDRMKVPFPQLTVVSELIAAGWTDVQSVMVQFMCSAKHRNLLTSCAYDTIGWGVEYAGEPGGAAVSAQWPTYITADLACSVGTACTCSSTPQVLRSAVALPSLSTPYSNAQPLVTFVATLQS